MCEDEFLLLTGKPCVPEYWINAVIWGYALRRVAIRLRRPQGQSLAYDDAYPPPICLLRDA